MEPYQIVHLSWIFLFFPRHSYWTRQPLRKEKKRNGKIKKRTSLWILRSHDGTIDSRPWKAPTWWFFGPILHRGGNDRTQKKNSTIGRKKLGETNGRWSASTHSQPFGRMQQCVEKRSCDVHQFQRKKGPRPNRGTGKREKRKVFGTSTKEKCRTTRRWRNGWSKLRAVAIVQLSFL